MFKWKPDLLTAASSFNRAGDAYARAMRVNDAVDCWERAADASTRDGNATTAAVCLDKSAKALEREGRPESLTRIAKMFERVAEAFIRQPDVIRAAESMASAAAAAAKANNGAEADRLYSSAADLFDAKPDRAVYATKPLRAGADHLVRLGMHRSAMTLFTRLMTFYERCDQRENRCAVVLSRVVLLLHAGDDVAAGQEFDAGMRIDGFLRSREGAAADDLIAVSTPARRWPRPLCRDVRGAAWRQCGRVLPSCSARSPATLPLPAPPPAGLPLDGRRPGARGDVSTRLRVPGPQHYHPGARPQAGRGAGGR